MRKEEGKIGITFVPCVRIQNNSVTVNSVTINTHFFYKNKLYKNIEAEKPRKLKNILRICSG